MNALATLCEQYVLGIPEIPKCPETRIISTRAKAVFTLTLADDTRKSRVKDSRTLGETAKPAGGIATPIDLKWLSAHFVNCHFSSVKCKDH